MSGYWYPVTCIISSASIDWCEANYAVSNYIVEFWNTVSSLLITTAGIYDVLVVRRCRGTVMEYVMSVLFMLVGLGSAAFHGTLKFEYQLWDEIPMLWTGSTAVYTYLQLDPRFAQQWKGMLVALLAYNVLWWKIHSVNAFVLAFQVNFVCLLVSVFLCMVYYQHKLGDRVSAQFLRLYICVTLCAFTAWMADTHFCEFLSGLPANPQLHSWWHAFCSLSSHSSLMFEMLLKARWRKATLKVSGNVVLTLDKHFEE